MLNVCALGELLVDFSQIRSSESFLSYKALPGGAPCNFLAACAKNGCFCSFIGKVGNDDFGIMLRKTLENMCIDTSGLIADSEWFTTLAFVSLDDNGERSFSFSRKPGADTMLKSSDINYSLINKCDIFHFGTLSLTNEPSYSATLSALNYAKNKNKFITFDPNYRASLWLNTEKAIEAAKIGFRYADIVKLSEEEAHFYLGANAEDCAELLLSDYNVKLAAITMGEKGCYCKTPESDVYMKGINNAKTVDTTGAGDIWFGYFISNLAANGTIDLTVENVINSSKIANAAASLSTSVYGGITSVPLKEETISYLKKNENI